MGQYKRKFGIYSAWNYELEIEDLNRMSADGWQLIKGGGLFSNKFKRNTELQYRYQLDFQPNIEDKGRYIETFREQGWEYINSTFNGWHYFRKLFSELFLDQLVIFRDEIVPRSLFLGRLAYIFFFCLKHQLSAFFYYGTYLFYYFFLKIFDHFHLHFFDIHFFRVFP